jgi:hypothetical protein
MRFPYALLFITLTISSAFAAAPTPAVIPSGTSAKAITQKATRLFCKTGAENRSANTPLKLHFQYHLPVMFEPEDPTLPFGRQVMVLSGRPLVQLNFEKSPEPAGENGEKLAPMTCAFAKRVVAPSEPAQVQIFLPTGQVHWLSQSIGQRTGPKQLSFERAVVAPAGDWAFASQFEKVFSVELEDTKNFVTTQLPR